VCISASEKKTTASLYLTVEQVREAACVWVEAQDLSAPARRRKYRKAAARIAYYQRRNQQARQSHTKTTRQRLRNLGITVNQLRSCVPGEP
jgi:hypothetical protein